MLCSTILILLIHLGLWSLNEDWHIYKIVKPVVFSGVVVLLLTSLTCLMVKIMYGENQIQNWKFDIYMKQWNTEVDRSWCRGAWLPVAPEIWYLLIEYLINISI